MTNGYDFLLLINDFKLIIRIMKMILTIRE
jgi:hypothetical protein